MNLKSAAMTSTLVYVLLLTLRAFPILSPDEFSLSAKNLPILLTPPNATIRTPENMRRAPDNTFLTFPEWFLVYSPSELARYSRTHPLSGMLYYGHILQFWQGYADMCGAVAGRFPFNTGYHVMIWVIGCSTNVEYGLEGLYENAVGAITASMGGLTDEDRFAAESLQRYVEFLSIAPWYRFNYLGELRSLWTTTPLGGNNPVRKWERRYYLTTVFLAKAIYGWAMQKASESAYGVESEVTSVVIDHLPSGPLPTGAQVGESWPDGSVRLLLPRYAAFADAAAVLAAQGVNFQEIAGNRGSIMLSVLAPFSQRRTLAGWPVALTQPILTDPPQERFALIVPIASLSATLRELRGSVQLEHIYDF